MVTKRRRVTGAELTVNCNRKDKSVSAHISCDCGRKRGDYEDLGVTLRRQSRPSFSGGRLTASEYSEVVCMRPGCMGVWRTKADYVDTLPNVIYARDDGGWLVVGAMHKEWVG